MSFNLAQIVLEIHIRISEGTREISPEEKLKMVKPKAVDSKYTRWPLHDLKLMSNNADVKQTVIKMMARMSPLMLFNVN